MSTAAVRRNEEPELRVLPARYMGRWVAAVLVVGTLGMLLFSMLPMGASIGTWWGSSSLPRQCSLGWERP